MKKNIFVIVVLFLLLSLTGGAFLQIARNEQEKKEQELLLVASVIADANTAFCNLTRCKWPEEKQEYYEQLSGLCTSQFVQKLQERSSSYPPNEGFPSWEVVSLEIKIEEDGTSWVDVLENRPKGKRYVFSFQKRDSTFLLNDLWEVENFL